MTEPVKRYFHSPIMGMQQDNRDGDWCRYEPRFDAPQLSREGVDLIEWAWLELEKHISVLCPQAPKLSEFNQLITRLRAASSPKDSQ